MMKELTNFKTAIWYILLMLVSSCSPDAGKMQARILEANELKITETFHGGIAGSGNYDYTLKKIDHGHGYYEWILIKDRGTDFQSYISLDSSDIISFKNFVLSSFKTNNPDREYANSCVAKEPSDYKFKVGFATIHLKPSLKSDSIFKKITKRLWEGKGNNIQRVE